MLTAYLSVSAFLLAYTAAQSTTSTAPAGLLTSAPGIISPLYALRGYDGCNSDQESQIQDGFTDAIHMLMGDQITGNYPTIDWNSAVAQDFWGPYERNNHYRNDIIDNLNRAASVSYQWWINPFAAKLRVRCDDPDDDCTCTTQGETDAYNRAGRAEINFCPGYFKRPDLATVLVVQPEGLWEYVEAFYSKATCWVHELMHIRAIGNPSNPLDRGVIDQPVKNWPGIHYDPNTPRLNTGSYGSPFTKWAAQSDAIIFTDAVDNADNYALFATAYYMQKNLGYYPHLRQVAISPTSATDIMSADVNGPTQANLTAAGFVNNSPLNTDLYCYTPIVN